MIFRCLYALLVLLAAAPLCAATPEPAFNAMVLLDADQSDEARSVQLTALKAAADRREHSARCLLGRLGLQKQLGSSLMIEGDYGDPSTYLNACVMGGDLDAMLVLAEVELHAERPLEAMIWAQAYLKLAMLFGKDYVNQAAPYKAGLIARIEHRYFGRRPENEEVQEYVAGLLDKYGQRIVEKCQHGGCDWLSGVLPPQPEAEVKLTGSSTALSGRFTRDTSSARDELVFGTFLLAIDEDSERTRS